MKKFYNLRDIIAQNCFVYNTLLRKLKKILLRMNVFRQIFMSKLELGHLPKSLALILFQSLDNSLFAQTIKKAAAFLIHQTGKFYLQVEFWTWNYGPKMLEKSIPSIQFCKKDFTNLWTMLVFLKIQWKLPSLH